MWAEVTLPLPWPPWPSLPAASALGVPDGGWHVAVQTVACWLPADPHTSSLGHGVCVRVRGLAVGVDPVGPVALTGVGSGG